VGYDRIKNQSEQDAASTQQDSTFQLIVRFKQYHQSLTRKSWQRQSFVDNVLINLWQRQMKIEDVKSQSIKWQCRINKVDLKLPQHQSNFDIPLSFVDQSSSTFQLIVASLNKNTLSFNDSVDWSSVTFKLVVVSNTIEYLKGSFKVSLGAFLNGAPAITTELIVALTSKQSNHELTKLNSLVVHHKLIELIKGFVGHSELTKLTSLVHICHIKLFKLSRLIVNYILIPNSEGAQPPQS
jgi:hypothetical protein